MPHTPRLGPDELGLGIRILKPAFQMTLMQDPSLENATAGKRGLVSSDGIMPAVKEHTLSLEPRGQGR